VVISALAGKAGVGKTALAVQVGHRLRARFPDGQLYVNLRGAERQALDPGAVLSQFLRALGMDGSVIPEAVEERAALYRARLADRRVLVVLDNAADEAQVRPLLPGTAGCSVLVTSRSRLAGLEGARLVDLDVLETGQAIELLGRIAGAARVAHEPEAATAIVDYCGRLPLAVRVAGARLAARPAWPLRRLVDLLADERRRLDHLSAGDLGVRASLGLSYRTLGAQQRRTFRLLGLLDVADFAAWVAAPLLDTDPAEAERLVEDLVDAQLLDVAVANEGGPVRYRFHDLVRLYARERSVDEEKAAERAAAITRALAAWLAIAEVGDQRLPDTSDVVAIGTAPRWHLPADVVERLLADPTAWFESERTNLVVAVETAAAIDCADLAWEIVGRLTTFYSLHGAWDSGRRTYEVALAACVGSNDRLGEGATVAALAKLEEYATLRGDARAELVRAVAIFDDLGDRSGQARALDTLALAEFNHARNQRSGTFSEAADHAERALAIARELDARDLLCDVLLNLARIAIEVGQVEQACELLLEERSLLTPRLTRSHAQVTWQLANLERVSGRPEKADVLLRQALEIIRRTSDRVGETCVLLYLGEIQVELDRLPEAIEILTEAVDVGQRVGERAFRARALMDLGRLLSTERPDEASRRFSEAALHWSELGDHRRHEEALAAADALDAAGAAEHASEATSAARRPAQIDCRVRPGAYASDSDQSAGRTQPV
jgi:tetratricopeptide (TPR) repeat protein